MLNGDRLGLFADFLQILNYMELVSQSSNDRIMEELQHQNQEYFEKLFIRLDRIEQKLEEKK